MKQMLAAMMLLPALTSIAQARPIDWQGELDRCRAIREQIGSLLLAGQGSIVALSGRTAIHCARIERRALKHGAR